MLIEYSQTVAYAGLAIIFSFNGLTAYKLNKEKKLRLKIWNYFISTIASISVIELNGKLETPTAILECFPFSTKIS